MSFFKCISGFYLKSNIKSKAKLLNKIVSAYTVLITKTYSFTAEINLVHVNSFVDLKVGYDCENPLLVKLNREDFDKVCV